MAPGFGKYASRHLHNDSRVDKSWPEVKYINNYAVFMGYLSMAVTGTGILVFTWSTVVLLGGFVTKLATKDFWSLTVITLVQTRVFDVFLKGNISDIGYSFTGLGKAALDVALSPKNQHRLCSVRGMIRLLVFTILLCPLFALYMFGLFVSPWISLWRLWSTISWQDYRTASVDVANLKLGDNEMANLKPALLVLYSLALLQGVLFYYWAVSASEEKWLVKRVAEAYEIDERDKARESVSHYLSQIRVACEKDPSFARGRNLITYAVDLMESNSPANYHHGARILDTLIRQFNPSMEDRQAARIRKMAVSTSSSNGSGETRFCFTAVTLPRNVVERQIVLITSMIGSSSDIINKLVRMLDTKNPDDDGEEIRLCAIRIVEYFASEIRLDKIMYGIRSISSLLEHREGEETQTYKVYFTGMKILSCLARNDENLKLMSNMDDITKKIVTVIVDYYGTFHEADQKHDEWLSIALPGMQLVDQFVSAGSKSNNGRHVSEILNVRDGITILKKMLDCPKCKGHDNMQKWVIQVLTQIIISVGSKDQSSVKPTDEYKQQKERFIKWLVVRFLHGSGKKSFKKLSGESLAKLSLTSEISPKSILTTEVGVVDALTTVLLDGKIKYRKSAAYILEHLCRHYNNQGDKHFLDLKEAMIREIPKVLKRLIRGADDEYENNFDFSYGWSYYVDEQEALASLCVTVHDKMIRTSPKLVHRQLEAKATEICKAISKVPAVRFADLLKEARQEVDNLKTLSMDYAFSPSDDDDDEDMDNAVFPDIQ